MVYNQYRSKWNNYPKLHIVDRVPINLDIELTTRCNLKCIMCPHSFNPPKTQDLPIDDVKKIIDEFIEKGGLAIKFCYLGEPLLYTDLIEVIKYAKEKGIIETIIATNGTLLTTKISSELIRAGLDFIIFSVDSRFEDTYERIRVNGNFHKVRQNISSLFTLRTLMNSNTPKIQIQAIPMDINKCEINSGQYKDFWESFCDIIRISPFCLDYKNIREIGETPDFFCPSPFRRITIRVNGDIAVCCGSRNDNKILGNIYDNSLEEIWTGVRFNHIRNLMKEHKSHLIDCCKTCPGRLSYEK